MVLQMDPTLFYALPIEGGYSWTLTTRLGEMLRIAEEMYGPRDKEYTILGIEFCGDHPQIWYPGNCQNVAIQLSTSAMTDVNQACYQLAHECVHLLCPTGTIGATNLEEGLATYNSSYYMETQMGQPTWRGTLESYRNAEELVRRMLERDGDVIKRMRLSTFNISEITAELILENTDVVSAEEAEFLASKFVRH